MTSIKSVERLRQRETCYVLAGFSYLLEKLNANMHIIMVVGDHWPIIIIEYSSGWVIWNMGLGRGVKLIFFTMNVDPKTQSKD